MGCLALHSCKVKPAVFMPSGSAHYSTQSEEPDFTLSEIPEAGPSKRILETSPQIISIAPESMAVEKAPRIKKSSPEITFHRETARPDSIPDQRKTEPMGVAAAITGTIGFAGLVGQFAVDPLIFLIILAAGASLGIASLVRIKDQPRRFKGRFWGWFSIFLASLPLLFWLLVSVSYK